MLKSTKVILITAGVLVGLGLIIGGIAMGISQIRYGGVANMYNSADDGSEYVRQTMEIKEHIKNLEVDQVSSEINILPSDKKTVYIEYTDGPDYVNEVTVKDETLRIDFKTKTPWYHKWGTVNIGSFFNGSGFETGPVNVYLPEDVYNEVKLTVTSGDISVKDLECDELSICTVSGDIKAENCRIGDDLSIDGTSGEIRLKNVEAKDLKSSTVSGSIDAESVKTGTTEIDTTSGDITLDGFECEDTEIDTTSGDVRVYVIGEYNVSVDTVSGDTDIEANSSSGYPMDIDTTSGNITVRNK